MVLLVQWPAVIEPRPISFPLLTDEYIHFVHHYSEPQIIDYYFYLNSFTYNLSKVVEKKLATKVERGTGIDALVLQFLFARLNLLTKKILSDWELNLGVPRNNRGLVPLCYRVNLFR